MTLFRLFVAFVFIGALSSCGVISTVSRSASGPGVAAKPVARLIPAEMVALSAAWNVVDVRVDVPSTLRVSEANVYYPLADIVWREDAFGDRYAQVQKIMDDGLTRGLTHLNGPRPVYFDIKMSRFHSLTEKTRYSVGGVHNIIFTLTVVDAATGSALHGPVEIELDLRAYGGAQAFAAERRGHTQKVRILSHLTGTMRRQFAGSVPVAARGAQVGRASLPTGFEAARR